MNGTRTETYEEAVERIMRAYCDGLLTLDDVAAEMRRARRLQQDCERAQVEYEWRKQHARGVRRG